MHWPIPIYCEQCSQVLTDKAVMCVFNTVSSEAMRRQVVVQCSTNTGYVYIEVQT